MAKKSAKNTVRIVISLVFIVFGFFAVREYWEAALKLDIPSLLSAGVGALMVLAGILGLTRVREKACQTLGVILLLVAVVGFVMAGFPLTLSGITPILLPVLYIVGVQ